MNISKQRLVILCILAGLILSFHAVAKPKPEGKNIDQLADQMKQPAKWQGKIAPDFEIELLNGEKFHLADQIGTKAIIINFFATWCGPCNDEMPELAAYQSKHATEPLLMIAIDDDEKRDLVEGFVKRHNVAFPVAIDKEKTIKNLFGVRGLPTTVFIGADGIIHIYQIGQILNSDVAFEQAFRASRNLIDTQKGVTKDVYLKLLQAQTAHTVDEPGSKNENEDDKKPLLTGRAKVVGEKMVCPCGCDHKINECGCSTGKKIRERLKGMDLNGKNDATIIKELNKEFCEKDDKS